MTSTADPEPPAPPPATGNRKRSNLIAGLVFVAAAVTIGVLFQNLGGDGETGTSDPAVGHPLPFLNLLPLTGDGKPVSLDDLKGRVTLIDFWGTWCPPCIEEFPHIATLAAKYRDRPDFQVLAVSCGGDNRGEDFEQLRQETESFLREYKIAMPTYTDPQAISRRKLDMVVGFKGYPTTFVVDRQGVIRGMWTGYRPGYERQIEKLVGELLTSAK